MQLPSKQPARAFERPLSRRDFLRYSGSLGVALSGGLSGNWLWRASSAAGARVRLPDSLPDPSRPAGTVTEAMPFDHIVIVMMENHPYDNLFGTYCTTSGTYCPNPADGIPAGACVPIDPSNPPSGCVRPWDYTAANLTTVDPPHNYGTTIASINGGAMNGFYRAENAGRTPFGHYNGTTIPTYWDLAQQYALGDRFFS